MQQIDPNSLSAIQPDLTSGENILWAGQPKAGVIFHRQDLFLIPFSLFWGGFTIFWEFLASGFGGSKSGASAPSLFLIWGVPLVVIGQYLIWGPFLYVAWLKKRTNYAVTNKRVIVVQDGWKPPRGDVIHRHSPHDNQRKYFERYRRTALCTSNTVLVRPTRLGMVEFAERR